MTMAGAPVSVGRMMTGSCWSQENHTNDWNHSRDVTYNRRRSRIRRSDAIGGAGALRSVEGRTAPKFWISPWRMILRNLR